MGRLSDEWKYDELRPRPAKDREKAAKRIASMPYEEAVKEMEKLHSEFNINDVNDISRRIMDKTKGDPDNYGKKLDHEIVNDKNIDAIKDNFTPPGAKNKKKNLWKIGFYNKVGDDSDFKKFVREGDDLDTIVKQLREEYPEYANGGHDAQMAEEGEDLDEWLKLPGAQWHKGVKDTIDTNDNGKIEVDEMAEFQKSLDDYAKKNPKGREDIPVGYRR